MTLRHWTDRKSILFLQTPTSKILTSKKRPNQERWLLEVNKSWRGQATNLSKISPLKHTTRSNLDLKEVSARVWYILTWFTVSRVAKRLKRWFLKEYDLSDYQTSLFHLIWLRNMMIIDNLIIDHLIIDHLIIDHLIIDHWPCPYHGWSDCTPPYGSCKEAGSETMGASLSTTSHTADLLPVPSLRPDI